jgi:hypothetical protein
LDIDYDCCIFTSVSSTLVLLKFSTNFTLIWWHARSSIKGKLHTINLQAYTVNINVTASTPYSFLLTIKRLFTHSTQIFTGSHGAAKTYISHTNRYTQQPSRSTHRNTTIHSECMCNKIMMMIIIMLKGYKRHVCHWIILAQRCNPIGNAVFMEKKSLTYTFWC